MARGAARAAQGREGAHAAQRRAGATTPGAAVGSHRQAVSIRDRRGKRLAGRPLPRTLTAPRLSLHVRARLRGGVCNLLDDRRRVQRLRRPPGQPRRHAFGGVAGAAREAAGVQTADGLELPVDVLARQRLQRRLQRRVHRGATARRRHRIQLPARGACRRDPLALDTRRAHDVRGHVRHRRGHVPSREAGPERVRARGRRRLPHLFRLCARRGRPLGHVPVARPRPQGAQRDGGLVPPPRRVRHALSDVVGVVVPLRRREISRRRASARASQQTFFGASALLVAASGTVTIGWCASMSTRSEMPMPGGWTMSMAWMRMPGQPWPGAAASFLGMWVVMMVALLLPSLVPMLWRYRQAVGRTGETRLGRLTALVGVGYCFVWTVFGMAAFLLGVALAAVEMQQPVLARAVPIAVGVVVLIAGALQLTAWKARHLAY